MKGLRQQRLLLINWYSSEIAGLLNRNTVGKIIFCSRSRQWDLLDPDRR